MLGRVPRRRRKFSFARDLWPALAVLMTKERTLPPFSGGLTMRAMRTAICLAMLSAPLGLAGCGGNATKGAAIGAAGGAGLGALGPGSVLGNAAAGAAVGGAAGYIYDRVKDD
jgi:hypothetical protein